MSEYQKVKQAPESEFVVIVVVVVVVMVVVVVAAIIVPTKLVKKNPVVWRP